MSQLTIAQIVHDNERYFGLSDQEIDYKVHQLHYEFNTISTVSSIADAHLGRHGRLHSLWCLNNRKDITRQAASATPRSDAL